MARYTFFGRVIPERIPLGLNPPIEAAAYLGSGARFSFRLAVHASQIVVQLQGDELDQNLFTLRNVAADCARDFTDLVGYLQGLSFDVEIISAVNEESRDWTVFGIDIPVLTERRGQPSPHRGGQYQLEPELLDIVGRNIAARLALADFRDAIRVPTGTGFFCYRAIEAMMQSMKIAEDEADAAGWEKLRNYLRIDRSAIAVVQNHAAFPRHGRPYAMTDEDRARVFKITDEIVRRFLEFLKGGKVALREGQYDLVTDAV
jgi:hypothetical protein